MKVRFETFGCRLNRAEALEIEAKFLAAGWETTEHRHDADLIIVRGCSVTARAQKECETLLAHLAEKYPAKRVVATGCLARKRNEYLLNPRAMDKTVTAEADAAAGEEPLPARTARAWLKVQDGCDARCSFCIVPQLRGRSASVPFDDVLEKAKRFVDAGYREIVVTGCNLAQYSSGGRDVAGLAAALAGIGGCRFRFGSVEPSPVAERLVDVMASEKSICRFLHLSIQSASNNILAAMRRPYRSADVYSLIAAARKAMPDVALGCDVIAGFPGESDGDFAATRAMLERISFSKAHVFPFSARPGTAAEKMGGQIARESRTTRARILADVAEKSRRHFAARFKGKTVEIVVEDAEKTAGWTGEYLWCKAAAGVRAAARVPPARKALARLKVTKADGDALEGEPL